MSDIQAVVLLSGGLDSTTVLAKALKEGLKPHQIAAISFDYSQRHFVELAAAAKVCAFFGIKDHVTVKVDLGFAKSALLGSSEVPKNRNMEEIGREGEIPITYVPARNTLFLSYALALAEAREAREIHLGVNALDYSGYPDCRPEYLYAFEAMANLATKEGVEGRGIKMVAPLLHLSKQGIVELGIKVGAPLHLTHSCYDPLADGSPCGRCDSCLLRQKGFEGAGISDPVLK